MLYPLVILTLFTAAEPWPDTFWPTMLWPSVLISPDDGLDHLRHNRPTGEYAAPIPDSLVSTHELTRADGSMFSIVLEQPKPEETLTRRPGPTHAWPHMGCYMCLGNHMIQMHGQSTNYLHSITYDQWRTLHDNLHNGKGEFVGVRGSGEGYIGYEAGGSSSGRTGLLQRLLGRSSQ